MEATSIRATAVAEAAVDRAPSAEPSRLLRSRRTNDPFSGLSRNSSQGRRVADLLRGFLKAMGNPDDTLQQASALRAAELMVGAEIARSKLLAGDGDADVVLRLEGAAGRAVRALGINLKHQGREELLDPLDYAAQRDRS